MQKFREKNKHTQSFLLNGIAHKWVLENEKLKDLYFKIKAKKKDGCANNKHCQDDRM